MNRSGSKKFSPRAKVIAWTAAGLAGTGVLAGVASAAGSTGGAGAGNAFGLTASDVAFAQTTAPAPDTGSGQSSHPNADPTAGAASRGGRAKVLRQLEHKLAAGAVHGEVVVNTKKGLQTVDFQRGTVGDASGSSFQVTDVSGTTQSWATDSTTKVRERGQGRAQSPGAGAASSAQLTNGENVVVIGLKTGGTLTARLVVVVPAKATKPGSGSQSSPPAAPSASTAVLQG